MEKTREFGFPPVGAKRKVVEADLTIQQALMDHMLVRALEAHESSDYVSFDFARIIYGETKTEISRMEKRLYPWLKKERLPSEAGRFKERPPSEAGRFIAASVAANDFNVGTPKTAK